MCLDYWRQEYGIMSSIPLYNVQARFKFYTSEDNLIKEWKSSAKSNTHQTTFLEGILLKSLEKNGRYSHILKIIWFNDSILSRSWNREKQMKWHYIKSYIPCIFGPVLYYISISKPVLKMCHAWIVCIQNMKTDASCFSVKYSISAPNLLFLTFYPCSSGILQIINIH